MRRFRERQLVQQGDRFGIVTKDYGRNGLDLHELPVFSWNRLNVLWHGDEYPETVFSDEIRPVIVEQPTKDERAGSRRPSHSRSLSSRSLI